MIINLSREIEMVFANFMTRVRCFPILSKKYLPYGLRAHTRSICWLAEQVIIQNVKKNATATGLSNFADPISDISAWDVRFHLDRIRGSPDAHINVKVTDVTRPPRLNDIASVKALLRFYGQEPDALLFCVVMPLKFDNYIIRFVNKPIVKYYPWIKDFVVNPRNQHLQSLYIADAQGRTTQEFLQLVRKKALAKGLRLPTD